MSKAPASRRNTNDDTSAAARRRYHSPIREQQAAQTRDRIIAAGSRLVHELGDWDWKNLTARAVADIAGVSERTVHRHFATERTLRDAVLQRLAEESGVTLDNLGLDKFAENTARLFKYLSSFAVTPATVEDPSLASMDDQRRMALLAAVGNATPDWSDQDRETAAAVLDIAWHLPSYERLQAAWGFDSERAIGALSWLIDLVEEAIHEGRKPGPEG
jgi:AcrR family transcriptional regulator